MIPHEVSNLSGVEVIRERTRHIMALVTICSFFAILGIVSALGLFLFPEHVDEVVKIVTTVAGVLGGVVGAVIGFYFRSES